MQSHYRAVQVRAKLSPVVAMPTIPPPLRVRLSLGYGHLAQRRLKLGQEWYMGDLSSILCSHRHPQPVFPITYQARPGFSLPAVRVYPAVALGAQGTIAPITGHGFRQPMHRLRQPLLIALGIFLGIKTDVHTGWVVFCITFGGGVILLDRSEDITIWPGVVCLVIAGLSLLAALALR